LVFYVVYDINQFMSEGLPANLNPERMRDITRGFQSLQFGGLTWAALGLAFFVFDIIDFFPHRLERGVLMVAAVVSALASIRYFPKYYERRFGRVEPPTSRPRMSRRGAITFLVLAALTVPFLLSVFVIGPIIAHRADAVIGSTSEELHVLIQDPEHLVRFGPILYWALFACSSRWRRDSEDGREVVFYTLGAFFWLVFFLYPLSHPAAAQLLLWKVVSAGWFGITFMAMGLYQHMRVVLLLPRRPRNQTDL